MPVRRARLLAPLGVAAAGAATAAYAVLVERNRFTLRRFDVPVLGPGAAPLTVLHLSDLHLTSAQTAKRDWIARLNELEPDLVLVSGDFLAGADAIPAVLAALGGLLERPGAFVMGNNDYYAPRPRNPLRYFVPEKRKVYGERLPQADLREALRACGWLDLNNARGSLRVGDRLIVLAGVDDPHLRKDRYVAGRADPAADVRIGLLHSPEPRVLDRFADDGYDLLLAGHTHGGQIRLPFYGAVVTNCGIDRGRARWLSRWESSWLHVSAGLGTSPYAPVRFACLPEATLLKLVAGTG